tara:strand:- start:204 stop:1940 length:1737 start_codon:yes stop_codon:yes gene_type:complete
MASRAVVFRPINGDDISITPFEANTTFKENQDSYLGNHFILRHGIHNNQTTPISSSLAEDNVKNADGTFQTVTWKSVDHMFYRPETKHVPMNTMEHYNPRYTEKSLFYSCSLIVVPYVKHGENIKRTSVNISYTDLMTTTTVTLKDDKYGNLRDHLIDSASFVKKHKLIGYWGFQDEFRFFELNQGTLGKDFAQGKTHIPVRVEDGQRKKNENFRSTAFFTSHRPGVITTQEATASGLCIEFDSGSGAYIQNRDLNNKVNFQNNDDFAISFWCRLPKHQAFSSSKVPENGIITKRGVERIPVRINKKSNRRVIFQDTNITRTRYPFDISVTNHEHESVAAGKIHFRRSDGTKIISMPSVTYVTESGWNHVVCQKSGSTLELYVNGTRETVRTDNFHNDDNVNVMNPSHLMFGSVNAIKGAGLSGSLDEVRIYNTYLSQTEINSLSNRDYLSGSLYQTSVAGNAFYRSGQLVISNPMPKYWNSLKGSWNLEYKSSRTIYENEVLVKVPAGECNVSMNPSLRKPKSEKIQPQFTGSGFKPYITTVGLYDDDAQLLAVAKLARPIQKREDIDMNFLIRWDY